MGRHLPRRSGAGQRPHGFGNLGRHNLQYAAAWAGPASELGFRGVVVFLGDIPVGLSSVAGSGVSGDVGAGLLNLARLLP